MMRAGHDLTTVKKSLAAPTNIWPARSWAAQGQWPYQMSKKLSIWRAGAIAIGVLFIVVVTVGIMKITRAPAVKSQSQVTLVYVGADNCAPCDLWQRNQGSAFRNSAEFNRLAYREVKSPSLLDVLKDENWPADLRSYRQSIGRHAGVPLWLVIADDRLVLQSSGASQWQATVLPKIKSLLH
ncbi:MAG: hypothetical protein HY244_11110 [Rhizobiales bacterium]|nr:hypothetical protein [Hyphomicrobiales bacterium]